MIRQKMGCLALRNMCARSSENAVSLREMEADVQVQGALEEHGDSIRSLHHLYLSCLLL